MYEAGLTYKGWQGIMGIGGNLPSLIKSILAWYCICCYHSSLGCFGENDVNDTKRMGTGKVDVFHRVTESRMPVLSQGHSKLDGLDCLLLPETCFGRETMQ
jgi:hypothetical protein